MAETATLDRVKELRTALKAAVDKAEAGTAAIQTEDIAADEHGAARVGYKMSAEHAAIIRTALAEAQDIKAVLDPMEEILGLKAFVDQPVGDPAALAAAAGLARLHPQTAAGLKSVGSRFIESEAWKSFAPGNGQPVQKVKMDQGWEFAGADLAGRAIPAELKDIYQTIPTGDSIPVRFGSTQLDPIVSMQFRQGRVRDLFPVQTTSSNLIWFIKVTGFANAASPVPQRVGSAFGSKPQSSFTFAAASAPVQTVAHWEVAHRDVLADEPQLRGLIDTELLYGLRLTEDAQILNGTGTGTDLLGVLRTPGIQAYDIDSGPGTDTEIDAIRRAATRVMLAYYEPTGVVVHPLDWEKMELTKTTFESYVIVMNVAVGAQKTLWRLPVVDTPAIAEGTSLVGAFGLGATLYDREQSNIRTSDSHANFFVQNATVVLAEERLALATKRPESFVKVTLT